MLSAEVIGYRARFAWLGLALAVTIALAGTSELLSTTGASDAREARKQGRAERIERLHQEIAAQVELNTCLIQLHARCEMDCWREAERAHRPCPTEQAEPAALARKAWMDERRALIEAELARHIAAAPSRPRRR